VGHDEEGQVGHGARRRRQGLLAPGPPPRARPAHMTIRRVHTVMPLGQGLLAQEHVLDTQSMLLTRSAQKPSKNYIHVTDAESWHKQRLLTLDHTSLCTRKHSM